MATGFPNDPLDDSLADEAARLGATHRLRGADAIYAAVASRHQATLVTLDTQQLQRLKPVIAVMNPVDMLHNLMSSSG